MCNLNPKDNEKVEIAIPGNEFSLVNGQVITAENINDFNDFGKKESVRIEEFDLAKPKDGKLIFELPSKSVVLVQLK
jgi:alpha-N-arabinofuranosidase